jgi:cell division protein FtsI (penicillin-binding protein 3)
MSDLAWYRGPFGWRWLTQAVWALERAFKKAKAADKGENETRIRIFFLLALFGTGFLFLGIGASRCALFGNRFAGNGYVTPIGAARADVVDRNGQLLAVDLTHYGVYIDPREIWDTGETERVLTQALPNLQAPRLEKALHSERREYLIGGLTPDQKARLMDMGLPGVSFEEEEHRVYPLGVSGAHVIGFTDKGGQGLAGIERAFDEQIRKQAGGEPVVTSLDLRVQAALQDELEKAAIKFGVNDAVGIVTNVHTGEVLGMASWPAYDANATGSAPQNAMTNRAVASVYEPGSVFKVFTLAMGLDSGAVTLDSTFDVNSLQLGKRTIHDFHAVHGAIAVPQIFTHSSNIGSAKIALRAGGPTMEKYLKSFGLFDRAKSELGETAKPIVPKAWGEGTVASTAFGHAISVSPLNLAQGMGAIMNGGQLIPLTLKKMDKRPQGIRVVSEDTSRKMLDLMRLNVTAKEGSGGKADAPGLSVGGKTGTAELIINGHYSKEHNLSSFAAIFPTDGPLDADRYFVLIMLKDPKKLPETYGFTTAGWNSAPAAGRVIDRIAPFVGVKRAPLAPAVSTIAANAKPSGDEASEAIDETVQ